MKSFPGQALLCLDTFRDAIFLVDVGKLTGFVFYVILGLGAMGDTMFVKYSFFLEFKQMYTIINISVEQSSVLT